MKYFETGSVFSAVHHSQGQVRIETVEITVLGHIALDNNTFASWLFP